MASSPSVTVTTDTLVSAQSAQTEGSQSQTQTGQGIVVEVPLSVLCSQHKDWNDFFSKTQAGGKITIKDGRQRELFERVQKARYSFEQQRKKKKKSAEICYKGRTYELRLDEADIVSNASVSDLAAMQRRVVDLERDIEKQNDKDKNLLMRGKPLDAISPRQRNRRMSRLRDQVHSALWFTESFGFSLESVVLRNKDDQSTTTLQLTEKENKSYDEMTDGEREQIELQAEGVWATCQS
ncbi:uncharacterized protein LOC135813662 [Sycon ciliatum]|uniref:uncharacterized protein LOC135813662 n=1 Tax=Sycon ciliatum TaxID=27933 RepID=UPI0031F649A8